MATGKSTPRHRRLVGVLLFQTLDHLWLDRLPPWHRPTPCDPALRRSSGGWGKCPALRATNRSGAIALWCDASCAATKQSVSDFFDIVNHSQAPPLPDISHLAVQGMHKPVASKLRPMTVSYLPAYRWRQIGSTLAQSQFIGALEFATEYVLEPAVALRWLRATACTA